MSKSGLELVIGLKDHASSGLAKIAQTLGTTGKGGLEAIREGFLDGQKSKQCSRCKEVKRLSEFHNSNSMSDGKHSQCKQCRNELIKASTAPSRQREYIYAYQKQHREVAPEVYSKQNRRYHQKIKQEFAAGLRSYADEQRCSACGEVKPCDSFHRNHLRHTGLCNICIECSRERRNA